MPAPEEFITRTEYESRHTELVASIKALTESYQAAGSETRDVKVALAGIKGWVQGSIAGVGLLAAVATIVSFLHH